jgi:ribosomal protein S18 acetylase RimI-like enzyme
MQTRGADIELPGGGVVSLRPVAPDDEQFLLAVYASTRADELAQVAWSAEQKAAFVRMQFDAQRREYAARYPDAEYDVILLDARPVGRLWIGRDVEQIRLLDIALLPEAQNRGAGGALVRRLIEEARASGKRLRHMVFVLNPDAQRFYERLGFRVFEEIGAYRHMEWRADAAGGDAT